MCPQYEHTLLLPPWYILGKHSADFFTVGSDTSAGDDSIFEVCLTSGIDEDFIITDTHTKQPSDNESSFSNVAREDCDEESDEYKSDLRCGNIVIPNKLQDLKISITLKSQKN